MVIVTIQQLNMVIFTMVISTTGGHRYIVTMVISTTVKHGYSYYTTVKHGYSYYGYIYNS